jgi:hypothetical protein
MLRQTCLWRHPSATKQFIACLCIGAFALAAPVSTAAAETGAPRPVEKLWKAYPFDPMEGKAPTPSPLPATSRERGAKRTAATPAEGDSSRPGDSARAALFTALALAGMLALVAVRGRKRRFARTAAPARTLVASSGTGRAVSTAPPQKRGAAPPEATSVPQEERSVKKPKTRAKAAPRPAGRAAKGEAGGEARPADHERATADAERGATKPKRKRPRKAQGAVTATPAAQRPRKQRKKPNRPSKQAPDQQAPEEAAPDAATPPKPGRARVRAVSQAEQQPAARSTEEEEPAAEASKPARAKGKRKARSRKSTRNRNKPA